MNITFSRYIATHQSCRANFHLVKVALGIIGEIHAENLLQLCCGMQVNIFRCIGQGIGFNVVSLLLQAAKPRGTQEILDEADLIYRLDWACVDARIKGNEAPASLNADVVVERHMALNWLIGYDDDWDNVSTDT